MVEVVFPQFLNHHGTLFGGQALRMMDTAAFVAATRARRW
jgi:acyl-CoA hydrolase